MRKIKKKISKNVKKFKNPYDENFINNLYITKTEQPLEDAIWYDVYLKNKEKSIAHADYSTITRTIFRNWVDKEYERRGVNTFLHDFIEKDNGHILLLPDKSLTLDGYNFWKNRFKEKAKKKRSGK